MSTGDRCGSHATPRPATAISGPSVARSCRAQVQRAGSAPSAERRPQSTVSSVRCPARLTPSRISNTSVARPPIAPATSLIAVVMIVVTSPTVSATDCAVSWRASLRISFLLSRSSMAFSVPRGSARCPGRATMAVVASLAQWVEGARPRTLPNAIAPVIAGTGAAAWLHGLCWWKALLAMVVAVAMIVGVNYANDYSDGIRGTDDVRAGPLRLVGSKVATPRSVLTAAIISLVIAAVAGLALAWFSAPWLIIVRGLCIAGAWLYTGGSKPYGYLGLGEVAVFVFFGLVAVLGTQYTQALRVDWVGA